MRIRRIRAGEGPRLEAIRVAAISDAPTAFSETLEGARTLGRAEYAARAARGAAGTGQAIFVAEDGVGAWVGLVGGITRGASVLLVSMWVAPAHRRHGLASALVRTLLDWAATTGAPDVVLDVGDFNQGARALYASLGFALTGRSVPHAWAPGIVELEMRCALPAARAGD